jgi:pyruvate dehydrogenase phosphatase
LFTLATVLATDGLWEKMTSEQVVDAVGEYVSQAEKGRWAHEDANAAAHVVRNAFGGRDTETVASLLRIPPPTSRWHRDDITVTVVFFKRNEKGVKRPTFTDVKTPEQVDLNKSRIRVDGENGVQIGPNVPKAKL